MRLTVVGGGSTYTPELVDGFARLRDVLPVDELVLVDPDQHRLELVGGMSRRMLARAGHPATVTTTSDVDSGVRDADVVLLQLRVGGQAARDRDETWPLECGCVGQETTGAGGLAKALRTVPVVLDIAERVRRLARPDAWIVDFTNPVGIVTRALLAHGHRAVGLCNVAIGFQRTFAQTLGVQPHEVTLDHAGLNHLTWIRGVQVGGQDVLPRLLADSLDDLADRIGLPSRLVAELGVLPSYYLRYFYCHDVVVAEQRAHGTRAAEVAAIERELLDLYADPTVDTKPVQLERRGGAYYSEAAVDLVASLRSDRGDTQVVNVRNAGTLPFLPDDAVVEVPCRVGADGRRAAAAAPARAAVRRPGRARQRVRGAGAGRGGARRSGPGRTGPARAPAGGSARPGRGTDRPAARRERAVPALGRRGVNGERRGEEPILGDDPSATTSTARAATGGTSGAGSGVVLAVDGGNSKTELLLVDADGSVLASVRGPGSSPHALGVTGAFDLLDSLVGQLRAQAGMDATTGPVASVAVLYLAGADLPREVVVLEAEARSRGWADQVVVDNDTFALLRAGTDAADAVVVVCGAGINCSGVRADGVHVRFAALGRTSGDWGGGEELGNEALWYAAREEDGRGPSTALTRLVADHFGLPSATAVTEALHFGDLDVRRLVELAPGVLAAARAGDAVALSLVERLADEVALLAVTALRRLDLLQRPAAVVLGGGVLASRDPLLLDGVVRRLDAQAPQAIVTVVSEPPVLGAALAGLDLLGAPPAAGAALRAGLASGRPT